MNNPETEKVSAYHWILFAICFLSIVFGGIVSELMSIYLPVVMKEFAETDPAKIDRISAFINASFVFGWAAGGLVWGVIGDLSGRKKSMIYSIACYGIFTVLTGYMYHPLGITICRFMSGFGMGGVLVSSTTIMIEEWNDKSKAVFMGILSISMPVGIFCGGVITKMADSWRQSFWVGGVPLVLAIVSGWMLQESEKWKLNRTNRIASRKMEKTVVGAEHNRNLWIGSVIFGSMLIGLWAIFSWLPTWLGGLIASSNSNQQIGSVMMIFAVGGLSGGFISGWVLNAIGSRNALIACYVACSLCSFLLFKTNTVFSPIVYPEVAGIAVFFGISQGVLSVYIPELFQVSIRATATGVCFNIGRFFTATAVLFVGLLQSALGGYGNALFIFSFVFVIGLVTTLVAANTKRNEAPDLAIVDSEPT